MKRLVVVESPTKARTLSRFLGKDFTIKACMGHVKDLPKNKLGVDTNNGFKPTYVVVPGKEKILTELKREAKKAEKVYLASDPDREGEAIAWHVAEEIGAKKKIARITFHEITKRAIEEALANPGEIDKNKVDAQQARRVLDRLVGYSISPLLWKKVQKGLSAGRVQSVALRLICERENEIEAFVPKEYWEIEALLEASKPPRFKAKLFKWKGKKASLGNEREATEVLNAVKGEAFVVADVKRKTRRQSPPPPFITSTLQQEAGRKLGFTAKKTMMLAQQLYEGVELGSEGSVGLITYMRTDSVSVAKEAQQEAREFVKANWGKEFLPTQPPKYKSKKGAQEAHECIRPTSVARTPEQLKNLLSRDLWRLYSLIWKRFLASQMKAALFDTTTVEISAGDAIFKVVGSVLKFKGYRVLYIEGEEEEGAKEKEGKLPPLEKGEELKVLEVIPSQHFTQPPPRYTEASLVKTLEEKGIGRPSTYATIISTIQDRGYVRREKRTLFPTPLGRLVNSLLVEHFPKIVDYNFTAQMEENLDKVEEGKENWVEIVRAFYIPFSEELSKAEEGMQKVRSIKLEKEQLCPQCGKPLEIKFGRFGQFLGCTGYPECRYTQPLKGPKLEAEFEMPCFKEGCDGVLVPRRSRRGVFYGCNRYPKCKTIANGKPVQKTCPECDLPYLMQQKNQLVCPRCGHKEEMGEDAQG